MSVFINNLEFIIENRVAILKSASGFTNSELIIPPAVNGFPVVAIAKHAIAFHPTLVNIGIPASVKSIGECAFSGCKKLENVKFYKTPTVANACGLERGAFSRCCKLKSIMFPNKIIIHGDSVFRDCSSLAHIKGSFNSLLAHTFDNCSNLKSLDFFGKTFISSNALQGCSSLSHVKFFGELSPKTMPKVILALQKMNISCYENSELVDWAYSGTHVEIMESPDSWLDWL